MTRTVRSPAAMRRFLEPKTVRRDRRGRNGQRHVRQRPAHPDRHSGAVKNGDRREDRSRSRCAQSSNSRFFGVSVHPEGQSVRDGTNAQRERLTQSPTSRQSCEALAASRAAWADRERPVSRRVQRSARFSPVPVRGSSRVATPIVTLTPDRRVVILQGAWSCAVRKRLAVRRIDLVRGCRSTTAARRSRRLVQSAIHCRPKIEKGDGLAALRAARNLSAYGRPADRSPGLGGDCARRARGARGRIVPVYPAIGRSSLRMAHAAIRCGSALVRFAALEDPDSRRPPQRARGDPTLPTRLSSHSQPARSRVRRPSRGCFRRTAVSRSTSSSRFSWRCALRRARRRSEAASRERSSIDDAIRDDGEDAPPVPADACAEAGAPGDCRRHAVDPADVPAAPGGRRKRQDDRRADRRARSRSRTGTRPRCSHRPRSLRNSTTERLATTS